VIHHRHALGHAHRVVIRQDHDPEAQPDALGQAAQGAEEHLRAGRHREAGQEVVLDEPEGVEAHLVGEHGWIVSSITAWSSTVGRCIS
jgi:hypothetical protein